MRHCISFPIFPSISEIKNIKETRKHFEKISDDMDSALNRNSQAQKTKPQECEDAFNLMMANKSCFAHTSLDYVYQVIIQQFQLRIEMQMFSLHWMMLMFCIIQGKLNFNPYNYILYYQSNMPYNLTPSPACYPFKMIYFICNKGVGTATQQKACTQCHDDM